MRRFAALGLLVALLFMPLLATAGDLTIGGLAPGHSGPTPTIVMPDTWQTTNLLDGTIQLTDGWHVVRVIPSREVCAGDE